MTTIYNDRTTAQPHDRTTRYVRNSKTLSGRLHDEMVMMNLDLGKYFSLNAVATRIWDLLEKPMTANELCTSLMEEFDVKSEKCCAEVEEFLLAMESIGLINAC
jgi:hypothetical protein